MRYEMVIEGDSPDHARVELWVTTDGRMAVGLETRDRVATRLRVRNRRPGFATGHEPEEVSKNELIALLDAVAGGELALVARIWPLIGLGGCTAIAGPGVIDRLRLAGYAPRRWLATRDSSWRGLSTLRYRRWT
ncbi:MAG: hypothetical protein R3195_20715 [Gemmatimonadota bacterium]|nr:hypothetical protein [Gemmatimonadota bacterium]